MYQDNDEILRKIRNGEDSFLELKDLKYKGDKVISPDNKSMADELAAMANTCNGSFIFGVHDKTKTITGIPQDKLDVVETWLRNICNDSVNPSLYNYTIQKITVLENGEYLNLVKLDVPKSLFVHASPNGYFCRCGSSKRPIAPDFLARLFQQRSQARIIRFDEQIVPGTSLNDLNPYIWARYKSPLTRFSDEEFLQKIKLVTIDENNQLRPTVSGILMATDQPQQFITSAYIQAVAYRGKKRNADFQVDAQDITGTLDKQIRLALDFVKKNMKVAAQKIPQRRDLPQYSLNAVFEAIVNAVAHRDYSIYGSKIRLHMFSDRLEIYSPGAIANTMTIDSLPLRQSSRNELLTSLLAKCPVDNNSGLTIERTYMMDKRGEGVPIILEESEKLSGKKPLYQLIDDAELLLTIYAANNE